jgi:hypothetical protein
MNIQVNINFRYHDEKQAEIAFKSLIPDNIGFLESRQENDSLICNIKGNSLKTVLSTADDLISA